VSAFARPLQPTVARAPLRAAARVDWVDGARAIGILLVMVGHLQALPTWLGQLIFSLHVPLFFWLSGWLCDPAAGAGSARTGVGTTLRRLAVPYALFFGLSWAYWMLTRGHPSRSVDHGALHWSEPWVGFVLGIGPQMIVNPTLWFFPCLIATTILFGLLARSAARLGAGSAAATAAIAVLAAALLAILPAPSARWPWGLDIVPSALLLFALGHACRIVWPVLAPGLARTGVAATLGWSVVTAAWGAAALARGPVDLQALAYGGSPWAFVVVALLGIAAVLRVAHHLPVGPTVRWLSRNTLILFPTHVILYSLLTGIGKVVIGWDAATLHSAVGQLAILAATLVLSVPTVAVCRRLLDAADARAVRTAGA
jgi:acyltransferase